MANFEANPYAQVQEMPIPNPAQLNFDIPILEIPEVSS